MAYHWMVWWHNLRLKHRSCASVRAVPRWRWCRRARCRAALPQPPAPRSRGLRSKSFVRRAISSRTGRWPRPAAKGFSPRRSRRRCWPGASILLCTPRRIFRPPCQLGLCSRVFHRARTRAMRSSAGKPRPCASCRRAQSSAPRRRAGRLWSKCCGRMLPPSRCVATWKRGFANLTPAKWTQRSLRSPA